MRFTDEHKQFAEAIASFCARECGTREQRLALTEGGAIANSRELLDKLAELGWLGVSVPEEYGGAGAGMVEECIFLEETSRGLAPIRGYSTAMTAGATYLRWGTEEQKREVMGGVCRGRLESIALSEPGAGSDLGGVRCRARRDGDEYVIDGQKTWISEAHLADHMLTLVRDGLERHQAPGPDAADRADRRARGRAARDRDHRGQPRRQRRLLHRLPRPRARTSSGEPEQAWSQLMRGLAIERRDHRRDVARRRPALARGPDRLRQGARGVRQDARPLPGRAPPDRRPRDRDRLLPRAGLRHRRAASTPARRISSPRSPRWPSSSARAWPRRRRSRACS